MSLLLKTSKNFRRKIVVQALLTFLVSVSLAQQRITVSGKVTNGEVALEKVSVKVLGSKVGTTTDQQGEFKIAVSKGQTLAFSYVGYVDQAVVVDNNREIAITMKPSSDNTLNDVVVIGYGTKRKVNL